MIENFCVAHKPYAETVGPATGLNQSTKAKLVRASDQKVRTDNDQNPARVASVAMHFES